MRDCDESVRIKDNIGSGGGFSCELSERGFVKRDIFLFPTKVISASEREENAREFLARLYKLQGEAKTKKVDDILTKLAPKKECPKQHYPESDHARSLAKNVSVLPAGSFRKPNPDLAISTPGPRVDKVPDIFTPHTPQDSLRIITHLGMSEDDARYLRSYSLVGLATEYSVRQLRSHLMGNGGQGWVQSKKETVKKWYRTQQTEINNYVDGRAAEKDIFITKISKSDIIPAVQHWATTLTSSGQYVDMQSLPDCPDILRDAVLLMVGNDSGQVL